MINKRRIYKLLIKGSVMASFHPPLMLQSEHKKINQLPRLGGRWVPGKPRGFHCGQPCQPLHRILPHGWQIPAIIQPWAPIPGTRHTDETLEGRKIRDGGKGKMLKKPLHRPLHKCSKKNSQILAKIAKMAVSAAASSLMSSPTEWSDDVWSDLASLLHVYRFVNEA